MVLDSKDYTAKSEELLHQPNYKILKAYPTNKYKNKLIGLLKTIKAEGGVDDSTYRRLYPTGTVPPMYYGLPKVHKPGMPLRPFHIQHRISNPLNSKRIGPNHQTPSGRFITPCQKQHGLHTEH